MAHSEEVLGRVSEKKKLIQCIPFGEHGINPSKDCPATENQCCSNGTGSKLCYWFRGSIYDKENKQFTQCAWTQGKANQKERLDQQREKRIEDMRQASLNKSPHQRGKE